MFPKKKRPAACSCDHDAETASFRHQPLQDATTQVRLLHLHPAKTVEAPLCGMLLHADLAASADQYEAISYTWSGDVSPEPLFLAGKPLHIRGNLRDALRRIRLEDRIRNIWVDAVCIDQAKDDEKTVQVSQMGEVYSKAARTIIWLGEDSDQRDGRTFFKLVKDLERLKSRRPSLLYLKWVIFRTQTSIKEWAYPPSTDFLARSFYDRLTRKKSEDRFQDIHALEDLFIGREWFFRRWVIQESFLSRSAVVKCGAAEVDRGRIVDLEYLSDVRGFGKHCKWNLLFDGRTREYHVLAGCAADLDPSRLDLPSSPRQIIRLLQEFDISECDDPRDRLAALLGIYPRLKSLFSIDYSQGTEKNYIDFAKAMMSNGACIDVLWNATSHRPSSLPSWVPDWRQHDTHVGPYVARGFRRGAFMPQFLEEADGRHLVVLPFIKIGTVMSVEGEESDLQETFRADSGLQCTYSVYFRDRDLLARGASGYRLDTLVRVGDIVCVLDDDESTLAEAQENLLDRMLLIVLGKTFDIAEGLDTTLETYQLVWICNSDYDCEVSSIELLSADRQRVLWEDRHCEWLALE